MKILLIALLIISAIILLGWLGLSIKPRPFAPYPERSSELATVPLPGGLPAPVELFYHTVYGERVPVIETVVISGRGTIRPVLSLPLPARFIWVHRTGRDYRHYFEATLSCGWQDLKPARKSLARRSARSARSPGWTRAVPGPCSPWRISFTTWR